MKVPLAVDIFELVVEKVIVAKLRRFCLLFLLT
jgi:hypothetical protein